MSLAPAVVPSSNLYFGLEVRTPAAPLQLNVAILLVKVLPLKD